MRFAGFLLIAGLPIAGADLHVGYDLHGNAAGVAHGIAGEAAWEYVETGFAVGYGAKVLHEEETVPAAAGAGFSRTLKSRPATAFRLDAPIRSRLGKWPYLFGQLGYERILKVEGLERTLAEGFAKANEFTLYYGAGYALWLGRFGFRLEMGSRAVLTDTDKTRYYRDPGAHPLGRVVIDSDRFASAILWQAGLRYRFPAPKA